MKCANSCANPASHSFYRPHHDPVNVCDAHLYVTKSTLNEGEYIVRPITLAAHIEDYEKNKQCSAKLGNKTYIANGIDPVRLESPLATQLRSHIITGLEHYGKQKRFWPELADNLAEIMEEEIAKQVQEARNEFYDSYVKELRHTVIREGDTIMLFELCNSAARHAAGLEERE